MKIFTSLFSRFSRYALLGGVLCLPLQGQNSFYMEVESVPPAGSWVMKTDKDGYYGTGYYQWMAGDNIGSPTGIMTYHFTLSESGKYVFDVRGRRDKEGRCVEGLHDICNDIYVNIAGKGWAKKMVKIPNEVKGVPNIPEADVYKVFGRWLWDYGWDNGPDMNIAAGTHTLLVAGRSAEVSIDAMRLYKQGATPPEPPNTEVYKNDKIMNSGKIMYASSVIESGEIYSYDGKLIKAFTKTSYSSLKKDLKPGMYVLKINTAGKSISQNMKICRFMN